MSLANLIAPNNLNVYCRSLTTGGDHPTTNTIQIGTGARAIGANSIAIGPNSVVGGDNAIGLGGATDATGLASISLGQSAKSNNPQDISIGFTAGDLNQVGTGKLRLAGLAPPSAAVAVVTHNVIIHYNGIPLYIKASLTP